MRPAKPSDLGLIIKLLDSAFAPGRFESELVQALLTNGRQIHHWLMERDRQMIAYVCYSRAYRGPQPIGWHLGPVAVLPEHQRSGYGSGLIRETLLQPPMCGSPVFVLGDPSYYRRFGFCPVQEPSCPFDPANEHFMALRYASPEGFMIGYEPEFGGARPGSSRE